MVFDMDRESTLPRIQRRPARDSPRHKDAIDLEAEVVVEPSGAVPLHDVSPGGGGRFATVRFRRIAPGLRCAFEPPFASVRLESHGTRPPSPGRAQRSPIRSIRTRIWSNVGRTAPMWPSAARATSSHVSGGETCGI